VHPVLGRTRVFSWPGAECCASLPRATRLECAASASTRLTGCRQTQVICPELSLANRLQRSGVASLFVRRTRRSAVDTWHGTIGDLHLRQLCWRSDRKAIAPCPDQTVCGMPNVARSRESITSTADYPTGSRKSRAKPAGRGARLRQVSARAQPGNDGWNDSPKGSRITGCLVRRWARC
jgi:hypothetical protein